MIKRLFVFLSATFIAISGFANEGMYLPIHFKQLLQEGELQGLELTADDIYNINNSSLKDAIVSMGRGFCTGEIISSQGLLLTNHHCAYGDIQSHSSVEHDYLADGFWAMNKEQELPNEGLYVRFLKRITNVTDDVLNGIDPATSGEERMNLVAQRQSQIIEKAESKSDYTAEVKTFYEGNEYYLFEYEVYNDVRLVGAPPESIGKFGGDTDNWMWPRQTGDFSLYRVYMSPDGKPADYSPENVPLRPKYHLPVSMDGVEEGDFAMIMGYPGSTDRYLTSYGVRMALEQTNPTRVAIRDIKLKKMKEDMSVNQDTRIKYASKYARVSNYWKYFQGQSLGLERLNVVDKKEKIEKDFAAWAKTNNPELYGNVLTMLEDGYEEYRDHNISYIYMSEAVRGSEILSMAYNFKSLATALELNSKEDITAATQALEEEAKSFFKDYNAPTDRKVTKAVMKMYFENVDKANHPEVFEKVAKKYNGNVEKWVDDMFENSMFDDQEKVMSFLKSPSHKAIKNDPAYVAVTSFYDNYNEHVKPGLNEANAKLDPAKRLFIRGLREMNSDKTYYPDANSTMRITYGYVGGYEPRDGVYYTPTTTLDGVMEKMDNADPEFVVPDRLVELYEDRDYGRYANEDGELVVGFISGNDITGGNSGSPVINGKGQLIGVAFDGNWEAMSGDIAFEPELQRTISVDIRYVLFIIDKFANAGHLVDEMTLVHNEKQSAGEKEAAMEGK
ncbi:S46 family peptidase [Roseivirga sp. BDSF3-8]|uniref:S46 family peptidase n=1 Tax=Roseivirga sp. BDSF3-8 TaxID=3241598 RepID=UPI003531DAE5